MQKLGFSLLILVLGAIIGWLLKPSDVVTTTKFIEKSDTVEVITEVKPDSVEIVKWYPKHTRDTVIKYKYYDSSYVADLQKEYYCLRQKLIDSGVENIQTYEKVTDAGDTLNIEYAAIADFIMRADIKFGAREVVTQNIRTVYIPTESNEDAWYVKPAIAISSLAVGYMIRGNP